jgi:transcriptional regulator ATRX
MEPILNGESKDASLSEIKLMKNRAYVLHKKLKPIIDRRDLSVLMKDLKPKREFVVTLKMTVFQQFLYKQFLSRLNKSDTKKKIFAAYQVLLRLWNHPACTVMMSHAENLKIG